MKNIYFFYSYDDELEIFVDYQKIPLGDIESIELGPIEQQFGFRNKKSFDILRIYYRINNESGYFHSFRASNYRFFNNLVISIKTEDELTGKNFFSIFD
jgi:hypothetical protein